MLKLVIIVAFLLVIMGSLAAAGWFMLTDRGTSKRTVNALTWRIGLSVVLILLVIAGIATGVIEPHGMRP